MEGLRRCFWPLWLPCLFLLWGCPATVAGVIFPTTVTPSPTPVLSCTDIAKKTCEDCVKNTNCLWCSENSTCMDYPVSRLIPSSLCELTNAYWGICWVNFEAILISIGVVAGVLLLLTICCCCYCCRRRHLSGRLAEEEERFIKDQEDKRMQSFQRKLERKVKHDEIRKKYGLLQDSDHPYSRYENE